LYKVVNIYVNEVYAGKEIIEIAGKAVSRFFGGIAGKAESRLINEYIRMYFFRN